MRISFITTGLDTGGAEMMLLKVLQRIDRDRFEPNVISLTTTGELGRRIEALGIPVEALGARPGISIIPKFAQLILRLRALRPDVVHTWMYHADLVGGLAARFAGTSAVGWGIRHSNLDPRVNKWLTLRVVDACARLSNRLPRRILSCSEKARRVHLEAGYNPSKVIVVPNGFDLLRFRPDFAARVSVRAELGVGRETPLVGMVARDDPQKNIEGFVRAATRVALIREDVHFFLAGHGLEKTNSKLYEAVEKVGLVDRLHLLGRRDDVPRLMAALDVLALSSNGEAFPNVVGEAMSCGVPCVVTDVGDSADIVGDTGRVVEVGDMEGLARELLDLLRMPLQDRRMLGERARQRIEEKYEIGEVVRKYERFYLSLVEECDACAE